MAAVKSEEFLGIENNKFVCAFHPSVNVCNKYFLLPRGALLVLLNEL